MVRGIFLVSVLLLWAQPALAGDRRAGGKLLLTNGVSSVDGAAGGGLVDWAIIAGDETRDGIGGTAHATLVSLPDFDLKSLGVAAGINDKIELSYAWQRFDTRAAGVALGLGHDFTFDQQIIGAKLKLVGDAVWDQDKWLPQIAAGVQYHIADRGAVINAIGGQHERGTDFYLSATKLLLSHSLLIDGTIRATKANQFGLLGFGGDRTGGYTAQVEGSAGLMLSRSLVVGGEYRSKPNNLRFAQEQDTFDLFAAWAITHHVSATVAYVDLGDIATYKSERGAFISLQGAF